MGCSFDRLGVTIDKKENIKTFVEIYNRDLADQLYWGEDDFICEDDFEYHENNGYLMAVEEEPLFRTMENGAQFADVIYKYLETVPDCKFSAWYECTFSNCGAIVYTTYDYKDGVLKVVDKSSENSYLDYCPECDWEPCCDGNFDEDELCTIDEWDPDEEYKCPQCGAVLEWDVCVDEYTLRMVDGELVEDED
jgi:hypothetical protein